MERWLRKLSFLSRMLLHRRELDQELDDEIKYHVEAKTTENIAKGMTPEEARRSARIELGGVEQVKEKMQSVRTGAWVETLSQDIRFGLRMLRKSAAFTAVAVLTLALGIGANTAMFSVVEGVVLAPLPYRQPNRLVMVLETNSRFPLDAISYPNFQDWQRSARSFDGMAAYTWNGYDLLNPGTPEHVDGMQVSAGFFGTLGVQPALGREFSAGEDQRGGAPVVIISNRLWRERFASNPQALGRSVVLDGTDYFIVGVLRAGFSFGHERADVYTPFGQGDPVIVENRAAHYAASIGRLKPGVTIAQAQGEMNTIQDRLDKLYPNANRGTGANVVPLKKLLVGDVTGTLLLLLGAVGLVLLIACANVANLLLARSTVRTREFAIRSALGASRSRVVWQLLTESTLLSLAGAILGLAIAKWGVIAVLAVVPGSLPRSEDVGINGPVLLFTLGVSIAVGILFGLAPALRSAKTDFQASLKEGGRGTTTHHRAQSSLVIVQMALTLVLLGAAGLLFRTIRRMWGTNPGFDAQHLITFQVGLSHALTKTPQTTRTAYQQTLERIRNVPGVQTADFSDLIPLSGMDADEPFWIGSQKPASLQAAPRVLVFLTGPDYLKAMGIPLLRGRFFTPQDTGNSPCVMVVDSVFAQMYFPGKDPIGQMISAGFEPVGPCRIVGEVGHVRHWSLGKAGGNGPVPYTRDQLYFPLFQDPDKWVQSEFPDTTIVVRSPLNAASLMPQVKKAIYGTGRDQTIYNVQTMEKIASDSMSSERFPMILLEVFAGIALILASIGIYGMISYSVAQRVHEVGIRMALGAEAGNIFGMIIGQGLRLALTGLAIGVAAALILNRVVASFSHLLYGVGTADPLTFAVVSLFLTGVAVLACYIPARRAMRVDPMVALRYE